MLGDAEPAHSLNDDEATIDVGDVDAYCYCVSVFAVEETSCLLLFIDRRSRTKTATQSKLLMLSSGCCIIIASTVSNLSTQIRRTECFSILMNISAFSGTFCPLKTVLCILEHLIQSNIRVNSNVIKLLRLQ